MAIYFVTHFKTIHTPLSAAHVLLFALILDETVAQKSNKKKKLAYFLSGLNLFERGACWHA